MALRRNPTDNETNLLIVAGAALLGWLVFGRKKPAPAAVRTSTIAPSSTTSPASPPASDASPSSSAAPSSSTAPSSGAPTHVPTSSRTAPPPSASSSPSLSFFDLPSDLWVPWDGCLRPGFEYQLDFQGTPVNFGVLSSLLSSGLGMVVQGGIATGIYTGTITACSLDAIVPIGAVMRQRRATSGGGFPSA